MQIVIEKLLAAIKEHPEVKNSSLGGPSIWKRTHYNVLAELISENLAAIDCSGNEKNNERNTTISGVTLFRIFTNDHSSIEHSDLRFLKSLDKLAVFLGFTNLNNFLNRDIHGDKNALADESKEELFARFISLIKNSCKDEFEQLRKLPEIDLQDYPRFIFHEGPLKGKLIDTFNYYSKLNYKLNVTSNRSNHELYDFKLVTLEEGMGIVSVEEFWNLEWNDDRGNIAFVLNKLNRQTYFFKKIDGIWKIWDNYNPNYQTMISDLNENIKKL
jgi:hypothetical protein